MKTSTIAYRDNIDSMHGFPSWGTTFDATSSRGAMILEELPDSGVETHDDIVIRWFLVRDTYFPGGLGVYIGGWATVDTSGHVDTSEDGGWSRDVSRYRAEDIWKTFMSKLPR